MYPFLHSVDDSVRATPVDEVDESLDGMGERCDGIDGSHESQCHYCQCDDDLAVGEAVLRRHRRMNRVATITSHTTPRCRGTVRRVLRSYPIIRKNYCYVKDKQKHHLLTVIRSGWYISPGYDSSSYVLVFELGFETGVCGTGLTVGGIGVDGTGDTLGGGVMVRLGMVDGVGVGVVS